MAMDKLFKGILQVTETSFKAMSDNDKLGHIIFVRKDISKLDGDAEVWFGTRRYGNVEATRLAEIESSIDGLGGRVDAIEHTLGKWTEEFTGNLQTVASVVKGHATTLGNHSVRLETIETNFAENIGDAFDKDNSVSDNIDRLDYLIGDGFANDGSDITAEILKIKESLEPEGDTARAIAAAQSAADKAQGEVDALEIVVGTKAAQSDLTAHTGNGDIHVTTDDKAKWDKVTEKAAQSDLNTLDGRVSTAEGEIDALEGRMGTAESKITAIETSLASGEIHSAIADAQDAADKAQGEVDALEIVVGTKAAQSDLTAHTGNGDIHVTTQQKTDWQNATNAINAFLDENATADNVINTLVEIREYLNGEDGSVETLLDKVDALEKSLAEDGDTVKAIAAAEAAAKSHADAEVAKAKTYAEEKASAAQTAAETYAKDAVEKAHSHANKKELDKFVDGDKAKLDTAVQTVSVAEGCEMLGATKEGTTVTLALYYGGDDVE